MKHQVSTKKEAERKTALMRAQQYTLSAWSHVCSKMGKTYISLVWTYQALVLCYVSKPTKESRYNTGSRNYWNFFFHFSFEPVHMWVPACHGTDLHFRSCLAGLYYVYHKNLRMKLRCPCLATGAIIHWAMWRVIVIPSSLRLLPTPT